MSQQTLSAPAKEARPELNLDEPPSLAHLKAITNDIGIWQHCVCTEPDVRHGFSIDDQARALIVGLGLVRHDIDAPFGEYLADTTLRYLERAQLPKGRFHNWCDANGEWVDHIGSPDSFGRTLWALGAAYAANQPCASRDRICAVIERAVPNVRDIPDARAGAYCILGLGRFGGEFRDGIGYHASRLMDALWRHSSGTWYWFEELMTYCNARLPQGLLTASEAFPDKDEYRKAGLKSLDFLLSSMKKAAQGVGYAPIGNQGWYKKGSAGPAQFEQQPVDAGALAEVCLHAARLTGHERYRVAATDAMAWYDGHNIQRRPMLDRHTGGVHDGLFEAGINCNMGAESVISYLMAYLAFRDARGA